MRKTIFRQALLLALLWSIQAAAQSPTFTLLPDSTVALRDSFVVMDVVVSPNSFDLKAYSIDINFDRTKVRTDTLNVSEGPLLATAGRPTFFWVGFSSDSGTLHIDGAVLGDGFTVTGGGIAATIKLFTIGFGPTDIEFTELRARNALNEPLYYNTTDAWIKVCQFRGDVNADNRVNIADVVYLINWIFNNGNPPIPDPLVGDVECTGFTSIADVVYLINWIFNDGAAPCGPCY